MTKTENANAPESTSINFPDWVKITTCHTITHTWLRYTRHGVVKYYVEW